MPQGAGLLQPPAPVPVCTGSDVEGLGEAGGEGFAGAGGGAVPEDLVVGEVEEAWGKHAL